MKYSKDYIALVLKRKTLVILFGVVCGVVSFLCATFIPPKYIAESTFVINRVNREASDDFQYDNYYAIQSAEFISNTVVGLLASPDVAEKIYIDSGVQNTQDAHGRVKNISARQKSSHLVNVKISDESRDDAALLLDTTAHILSEKVSSLEQTKDGLSAFELTIGEKVFSSTNVNPMIATLLGIIAGLFLGIALVFLQQYFSSSKE